jgi:hypothetical protein
LEEKKTPSIQWNGTKTIKLNIFIEHTRHQHRNGGKTFKEDASKDE